MTLPFHREAFFAVFAAYNTAWWPAQWLLAALGAACAWLALANRGRHARWAMAGLALLWAWMALAYHAAFFSGINPAAPWFAVAFLAQAAGLAALAAFPRALRFDAASVAARRLGVAIAGLALAAYPLAGLAAGQRYPEFPTFGLPCPTTILTIGIVQLAPARVALPALAIPFAWALVATTGALALGVPEDFALPLAAIAAGMRMGLEAHPSRAIRYHGG